MENVPDFIILKDVYDRSRHHKWSPGESFKCLINNDYYYGKVVKCEPFSMDMRKSLWQNCYVEWDDEEEDNRYLSPWDIQTTDSKENSEGMHIYTVQMYTLHVTNKSFLKFSIYLHVYYECSLQYTIDCLHFAQAIYFMDFANLPLFANYIIFDRNHVSVPRFLGICAFYRKRSAF